jgi:L-threonylcarbamoyladenylate synthase
MQDMEKDIEHCLKVLKDGGLILYPTDTVWGIGCDAADSKAVEKVYQLKKRADSKAMIVLVAEERDILKYVAHPDPAVFDFLKQTNKPTTVVYDGALGLADNLVAKDGSIAIRICKDIFCRHLIKRFRKPVVSTSANISGEKTAAVFSDISDEIKNGVDYIVQHRQDDIVIAAPSSVVRWNRDSTVTILRP